MKEKPVRAKNGRSRSALKAPRGGTPGRTLSDDRPARKVNGTHHEVADVVAGARPRKRRGGGAPVVEVRRMHRRDINRVWEFLKLSFRDVNLETVEYQRPRTKKSFLEIYEEEGVEQLVFEIKGEIVAYAECAHEIVGSDTWLNPRYFERREMRPLFVEELAVHPDWHGKGVGGFVLEQLHHLAKVRGLTHLVLEVAENNEKALTWYRKRGFRKLDAAVFMAQSVEAAPDLLPPRPLERAAEPDAEAAVD